MKKLYYFVLIVVTFNTGAFSQSSDIKCVDIKISVKKNIKPRYYYYPNLNAYFDLEQKKYIYKVNGQWISSDYISDNYRGYCVFNKHYVIIEDYFGDTPYQNIEFDKKRFPADFKGYFLKKNQSTSIASN